MMDSATLIIICASSVVPCLMMVAILLTAVLTVLLVRRNGRRLYSFAIPKVAYGEVWQTVRDYVAAGWEFDIINGDVGLCTIVLKKAMQ